MYSRCKTLFYSFCFFAHLVKDVTFSQKNRQIVFCFPFLESNANSFFSLFVQRFSSIHPSPFHISPSLFHTVTCAVVDLVCVVCCHTISFPVTVCCVLVVEQNKTNRIMFTFCFNKSHRSVCALGSIHGYVSFFFFLATTNPLCPISIHTILFAREVRPL